MTLQNAFDNRRWATSLFEEVKTELESNWSAENVDNFHYLKNWIEDFDRMLSFRNYPEHHVKYVDGFNKLRLHSKSL